jgi:2'-5' RNA ligase
MTKTERETALVVEVPAAEPVVGQFRRRLDANALLGIPAHVTILFPFMPAHRIDAGTLADLESLAIGTPAFPFLLDHTAWFGTSVLWVGPDDPRPFRELTDRVAAAFPEFPPFQGQFDEVVPHLTVGYNHDLDEMRHAEQVIGAKLPIEASAGAVTLMAELAPGGSWSTLATFSFAARMMGAP